jgi:hypothetical protein
MLQRTLDNTILFLKNFPSSESLYFVYWTMFWSAEFFELYVVWKNFSKFFSKFFVGLWSWSWIFISQPSFKSPLLFERLQHKQKCQVGWIFPLYHFVPCFYPNEWYMKDGLYSGVQTHELPVMSLLFNLPFFQRFCGPHSKKVCETLS